MRPPLPRDGEDAYFELSFSPNVRLVSTVRRFVAQFYSEMLNDPEATSQLAVATHELLENAVRYSADGNTSVRIGIRRIELGTAVTIETCNRAADKNVAAIAASIAEIAAASDPDEHYQTLMRRTAKKEGSSGLGLGRVRAEAGMTLTHEVDEDMVVIRAETRFARRGR